MANIKRRSLWTVTAALGLGLASLAVGCDGADDVHDPAAPAPAAVAKLTVDQYDPDLVAGRLEDGTSTVTFEGRALGGYEYDVTLRLNGAVLTAMGDAESRYHTLDGYAASNGLDTQLDAADGAALRSLKSALDRYNFDHGGGGFIARQTVSIAGVFQQLASSTLSLQREITGNNDRGPTMICGNYLKWTPATHDCDHGSDFGAGQWAYASPGERWVRGGGTATRQLFQDEPFWHNATFAHKGGSYIAGNCLGQCGGDCVAGEQYLTASCLTHDQCASGNHGKSSFWCDDELLPALADTAAAHVTCSGTGQDPADAVLWQNTNFPNQGVERKTGPRAICYQLHIADFAWTQEVCDDAVGGSTGLSKMGQAIKIRSRVPGVSVCYTVTMAGIAAPQTACDGAQAGTTGQGRRIETIKIFTNVPTTLKYQAHVDSTGWLTPVSGNVVTGQAGKSIQAMRVKMCVHDVCTTGANLVAASCDDPCVAAVCAQDSFCCNNSWDGTCKSEVARFCGRTCP